MPELQTQSQKTETGIFVLGQLLSSPANETLLGQY